MTFISKIVLYKSFFHGQVMMHDTPSEGKVFDLDIVKYVAASQIENYLNQGFKERYEYPLRSFVFHPLKGVRLEGKS